MSLSSWIENAPLRRGQRKEERDLHFEQAVGENKRRLYHITLKQLEVSVPLLKEEDVTASKPVFFSTLLKSFMWVQNCRFCDNFFYTFITVFFGDSSAPYFLFLMVRFVFFNGWSAFIQFSLLHSRSEHSPRQGSVQVWAPTQKQKSPIHLTFTHFLRLFAFSCGWPALFHSHSSGW